MRATVYDIAAAAGVSLATVDRVLNRRPGVRLVTREKVEAAIRDIGYVRDVAAGQSCQGPRLSAGVHPADRRQFLHARALYRGTSGDDALDLRAHRRSRLWRCPPSTRRALVAALDARCRAWSPLPAMALVATDAPDVQRRRRPAGGGSGFPLSPSFRSHRFRGAHHYAGVDNIAAGPDGGCACSAVSSAGARAISPYLAGSMLVRDHRERLEGFALRHGRRNFRNCACCRCWKAATIRKSPTRSSPKRFLKIDDIIGIYSLGAGNRGLIRALNATRQARDLTVVVHELTEHTRAALQNGTIDAVLNQDAAS